MKIENQIASEKFTFGILQPGDVFQIEFDRSYYMMTDEDFIVDLQTGELSSSHQYDSNQVCTVYETKLIIEEELRK